MNSFATSIALAFILASSSNAVNIDIPWDVMAYADTTAQVGDTITFSFEGQHNVYLHPTGTCDMAGAVQVGESSPVTYTFGDADAGQSLFFASQVDGHCEQNQHITVFVQEDAAAVEARELQPGAGDTAPPVAAGDTAPPVAEGDTAPPVAEGDTPPPVAEGDSTVIPSSAPVGGVDGETTEAPTGMVGMPGETMVPTPAATTNATDAATAADTPADTAGTTDTASGADTPEPTADTAAPGESQTMMPTRLGTQMPGSGASAISVVASLAAAAAMLVVN